ncbi:MAG: hypothetical protein K0S20_506, partial [Patescibacteria group bacterium]|nr:hypothetical protein [Patescibacteria group bacterium]
MSQAKIIRALEEGLAFIRDEQKDSGLFISLSSTKESDFSHALEYQTTFVTSLILSALSRIPSSLDLDEIKKRGARFLLEERSKDWSFNYWSRNSSQYKELPYPDDLDDTFCAAAALQEINPGLIDGKALASLITLLTATEAKPGGPYKTWIVDSRLPDPIWHDVDVAVNSNVGFFLSLQEASVPGINELIEGAIQNNSFTSPYYPNPFPIIYFISRFYKGEMQEGLVRILKAKRLAKRGWGNSLFTALALTSLSDLGEDLKPFASEVDQLLQEREGDHWPTITFLLDPVVRQKFHYCGSGSLTTAFCLEALGRYLKSTEVPRLVSSYENTATAVISLMDEDLASVPLILQQPLRERVKALASPGSSQKIMVL